MARPHVVSTGLGIDAAVPRGPAVLNGGEQRLPTHRRLLEVGGLVVVAVDFERTVKMAYRRAVLSRPEEIVSQQEMDISVLRIALDILLEFGAVPLEIIAHGITVQGVMVKRCKVVDTIKATACGLRRRLEFTDGKKRPTQGQLRKPGLRFEFDGAAKRVRRAAVFPRREDLFTTDKAQLCLMEVVSMRRHNGVGVGFIAVIRRRVTGPQVAG